MMKETYFRKIQERHGPTLPSEVVYELSPYIGRNLKQRKEEIKDHIHNTLTWPIRSVIIYNNIPKEDSDKILKMFKKAKVIYDISSTSYFLDNSIPLGATILFPGGQREKELVELQITVNGRGY